MAPISSTINESTRSCMTIELDFEGHGVGKLLVPLVVRREARKEMPANLRRLKERLESGDQRAQLWVGLRPDPGQATIEAAASTANVTVDRTTVNELLRNARSALERLTPQQTYAEMERGLLLVDIRADSQRDADGLIPGAVHVPRNVLEWRLDPGCPHRDRDLGQPGARVALICDEGYQSSLAAATVARFGLAEVTDVIGGFQAWRAAGLPVERYESASVRSGTSL